MGASFRNAGEILELAGCDLLTISPNLLAELKKGTATVERKLDPAKAKSSDIAQLELDEKKFRWLFNEDAMATEKTAEGIRVFCRGHGEVGKIYCGAAVNSAFKCVAGRAMTKACDRRHSPGDLLSCCW